MVAHVSSSKEGDYALMGQSSSIFLPHHSLLGEDVIIPSTRDTQVLSALFDSIRYQSPKSLCLFGYSAIEFLREFYDFKQIFVESDSTYRTGCIVNTKNLPSICLHKDFHRDGQLYCSVFQPDYTFEWEDLPDEFNILAFSTKDKRSTFLQGSASPIRPLAIEVDGVYCVFTLPSRMRHNKDSFVRQQFDFRIGDILSNLVLAKIQNRYKENDGAHSEIVV